MTAESKNTTQFTLKCTFSQHSPPHTVHARQAGLTASLASLEHALVQGGPMAAGEGHWCPVGVREFAPKGNDLRRLTGPHELGIPQLHHLLG